MANWDDVRAALATLPEVTEDDGSTPAWKVRKKLLMWERPLRAYEVAELGSSMRDAPILGARVPDVGVREALIADDPAVFFSTSHFSNYPAVLLWLDRADTGQLRELGEEAWLCQAPATLVKAWLAGRTA